MAKKATKRRRRPIKEVEFEEVIPGLEPTREEIRSCRLGIETKGNELAELRRKLREAAKCLQTWVIKKAKLDILNEALAKYEESPTEKNAFARCDAEDKLKQARADYKVDLVGLEQYQAVDDAKSKIKEERKRLDNMICDWLGMTMPADEEPEKDDEEIDPEK